jgi:hypothetical protein
MSPIRVVALVLVMVAACSDEAPLSSEAEAPVQGRLLHGGPGIEDPDLVQVGAETWVRFNLRRAPAAAGASGVVDVHLVNWADPARNRVLVVGRSDRLQWPILSDASGAYYYMTDERRSPTGTVSGTLTRVSLDAGVRDSIADVIDYGPVSFGSSWFFYRKLLADQPGAELHARDLTGKDRNLGPVADGIRPLGTTLYYLTAPSRTLTRVIGLDGPVEPLRADVARFIVSSDHEHAVVEVLDQGTPRAVVLDLADPAGGERPLPVTNPCCWLGFSGNKFEFAVAAMAGRPAELHRFDLTTGTDQAIVMPEGLTTVVVLTGHPSVPEWLAFDGTGGAALVRPDGSTQLLPIRARSPLFTTDGRYLLFVGAPAGGSEERALYAQHTDDWSRPPRRISPAGVNVGFPAFLRHVVQDGNHRLMFLAEGASGTSDLYFGDHEVGMSVRIAEAVGAVTIGEKHLFGVVNAVHDNVGDLLLRDLPTGPDTLVERGVSHWAFGTEGMAFVVRGGSAASPRHGLWAAPLPTGLR